MNKKHAIAATGIAAALGLGFGMTQFASADPTTTPSSPSSSATATPGTRNGMANPGNRGNGQAGPRGNRGGGAIVNRGFGGINAAALAEKLGVTEDKLKTALDEIRTAHQADADTKQGRPTDEEQAAREAELAKELAEKLGVSQKKVTEAITAIRTERQAEMQSGFNTRIDDAVKAGTLTETEGAAVKKAAEKGVIGMGGPRR